MIEGSAASDKHLSSSDKRKEAQSEGAVIAEKGLGGMGDILRRSAFETDGTIRVNLVHGFATELGSQVFPGRDDDFLNPWLLIARDRFRAGAETVLLKAVKRIRTAFLLDDRWWENRY